MNIDEVIENFRYDAENNRIDLDLEFAKENEQIANWLTKLKEYEDLEEQGRIIKLPCRDGRFEEEHIYDYQDCMEVIGNIFDNKELLEIMWIEDKSNDFKFTEDDYKANEMTIQALETIKKLSDRKMTTEVLENYMQFEDECVKKGFTFKSVIEAREKQIA